ncbi:hypothetical protein JW824_02595 [bacterium]|nr:hypothetical protein [bacterium]RQV93292.1 MAG: hypothetical protein EH221_09990 [bacterium]
MWENETIVLVTSLKKRILGENGRVQFNKIAEDQALPVYVKNIFKKRIEGFLKEESPFSFQPTIHFDLQPSEIEALKTRFLDIFWEVASFQEKEVEEILKEALVYRLNYILKPIDTIGKMLFEKSDTIDLSEARTMLDSFKEMLPYAGQILDACIRGKEKSLDKDKYRKYVNHEVYPDIEKDPVRIVMRDFTVLTAFLSETKGEEISQVEGEEIQGFLADRNLWNFRRALDVEMKLGKRAFNAVELEMTLKRYLELRDEFKKAEEKQESKKSEGMIQTESEYDKKESVEEEEYSSVKEDWDLGQAMDEESPLVFTEDEKEQQKTENEKPKTMRIIRREQKEETGEEIDDTKTPKAAERVSKPVQGISNTIDGKTEATFIKKLFDGDEKAYKELLNKLEEAETWRVAKILIDNELFKRDVDPFAREAIKLVDIVYSLYYPEEGVGGK